MVQLAVAWRWEWVLVWQAMAKGDATDPLMPPPVPDEIKEIKHYFAVIEGSRVGPINLSAVADMIAKNQLNADTLMWTAGLDDWVTAEGLSEVKSHLHNQPPAMPE